MRTISLTLVVVVLRYGWAYAEEGPFDARIKDHKPALTAAGGGTGKGSTEEAVLAGLRWLARHQADDGRWRTMEFTAQCPKDKECQGTAAYAGNDAGVTALTLLAFAGAGRTDLDTVEYVDPVTGKTMCWGRTVQKGLEWLMDQQRDDGCFGDPADQKMMYVHLVAAAALAEFYAMTASPVFEKSARAGIDFALAGQRAGAGWRYKPQAPDNDTSATAWGVSALMAARAAGIDVDKKAFADAVAWVNSATEEKTFKVGYTAKGTGKVISAGQNQDFDGHDTMTAAGIVIRLASGEHKLSPAVIAGARLLLADLPHNAPLKIDYYYWYYGTEAMFLVDGPKGGAWAQWNAAMKAALLPAQATTKDGCHEGSWDPAVDRWSFEGGRVLATALNVLTLETYYRVRPVYVKGK